MSDHIDWSSCALPISFDFFFFFFHDTATTEIYTLSLHDALPISIWVETAIRKSHSFLSFQHPDKLAEAIRLIHSDPIWPALENRIGVPAKDLKEHLKLIVDRRNKIAHEADIDPSYPGLRWPITKHDTSVATDYLVSLVEAINSEVT